MQHYKEGRIRSIIKALSWRVVATFSTITIVFFFTRKPVLSLEVGAVEVIVKLTLYYIHERCWLRIPNGRKSRLPAS